MKFYLDFVTRLSPAKCHTGENTCQNKTGLSSAKWHTGENTCQNKAGSSS
jgi:hypothetical protein